MPLPKPWSHFPFYCSKPKPKRFCALYYWSNLTQPTSCHKPVTCPFKRVSISPIKFGAINTVWVILGPFNVLCIHQDTNVLDNQDMALGRQIKGKMRVNFCSATDFLQRWCGYRWEGRGRSIASRLSRPPAESNNWKYVSMRGYKGGWCLDPPPPLPAKSYYGKYIKKNIALPTWGGTPPSKFLRQPLVSYENRQLQGPATITIICIPWPWVRLLERPNQPQLRGRPVV